VVGDEIAASPGTSAVGFIGSVATGLHVAARAAGKATLLELGGNGPMVVLNDADVDAAAEASLTASFLCAGQSCTAGERFLVHDAVHDRFVEALHEAVERSVRLGDPFAGDTTMGPLNNEPTAEKMDRHVADALERGARLVTGGRRASGFPTRLYWEPTVLADVTEEMEVAHEETFGPVVPVTRISGDEEAIRIANASPYGLLCAVWTRDLARGLRFAEAVDAGWVNVNESTNYWESHLPFGGRAGTSSGVGRVGGSSVLEAFTEPKTVVLTLGR
jgi:succinate-semialdehyde dehydrogenase/glutarate-semialdehyde dehydrogenase